ncbi:hypothetical protein [Polaribacter glomeratus]|uniref:Uncharacterized protein n=1 Tax=Polaribacter glomeratus TaxID=102 RepID=A0A2S7WV50_9FLAO|nr:hypothetical protein [Polaribacter glomeratus]PQJ81494.1 hypothetical protein BTO16_02400 [Polaribacter glomeratus]TXD64678.1 hypothetical protein ESX12_14165 [Polaribacter glomeratus]
MITIKCFGEGSWIHLLDSTTKTVKCYNIIAAKMKLPIEEALLDISFYQHFKNNIDEIDHLIIDSFGGLLHLQNATIEIWFDRKKVAKIPFQDLVTTTSLFPLYKTTKIDFKKNQFEKGIYLKETVIGCVGVYKIDAKNFDINLLSFQLLTSFFNPTLLLINFTYQNILLKKVKDDCLTMHQEIIILE